MCFGGAEAGNGEALKKGGKGVEMCRVRSRMRNGQWLASKNLHRIYLLLLAPRYRSFVG